MGQYYTIASNVLDHNSIGAFVVIVVASLAVVDHTYQVIASFVIVASLAVDHTYLVATSYLVAASFVVDHTFLVATSFMVDHTFLVVAYPSLVVAFPSLVVAYPSLAVTFPCRPSLVVDHTFPYHPSSLVVPSKLVGYSNLPSVRYLLALHFTIAVVTIIPSPLPSIMPVVQVVLAMPKPQHYPLQLLLRLHQLEPIRQPFQPLILLP